MVWHHATPRPLEGVLGKGPLGVDLFFAISGFLITTRLLRERERNGKLDVKRFYARRALRIFPVYYAVLAAYVVRAWLLMPDGPQRSHFLHAVPAYATFTSNWLVDFAVPFPIVFSFAWSLAVEEQFYAVWPWVVGLRARSRWLVFPALIAGLALAVHLVVAHRVVALEGLAFKVSFGIAPALLFGALLAIGVHHPRGFEVARRALGHRLGAPLALGMVVALIVMDGSPLLAVQASLALLVLACCLRKDHALAPLLEARPVAWIGSVSYGVYLFHVSAITLVKRLLPTQAENAPLVFALALPLSLLAAGLSHRFLERPFMGLGERLRRP